MHNAAMPSFTPKQLILLVLLTIIWGVNWPVMKLGVQHYPPLSFRMVSVWLGLAIILIVMRFMRAPLRIERQYWGVLAVLTLFNTLAWYGLVVIAIPMLSSGRAAILGYTMPIFSAVFGSLLFKERLPHRAWLGVAAALLGVMLLLWHEMASMGSRPLGVGLMLLAAACWAYGTQKMRRTTIPVPVITLSFWMMLAANLVISAFALVVERHQWRAPDATAWAAILFNAFLALAFAQVVWFFLARSLPPIASTLSVMLIPVIGVFSGAWWLGEVLHWQDWTAVVLMAVAIATVLWPSGSESQK